MHLINISVTWVASINCPCVTVCCLYPLQAELVKCSDGELFSHVGGGGCAFAAARSPAGMCCIHCLLFMEKHTNLWPVLSSASDFPWSQTDNRQNSGSMKTFSPEYPGNIDFCALQWLVSAQKHFLPIALNAAVKILPFVSVLWASETRGKNNHGQLWAFILDASFLIQTMQI